MARGLAVSRHLTEKMKPGLIDCHDQTLLTEWLAGPILAEDRVIPLELADYWLV